MVSGPRAIRDREIGARRDRKGVFLSARSRAPADHELATILSATAMVATSEAVVIGVSQGSIRLS